ncbi:MAG TPA: hypothetical protein VK506_01805 [Conexibacter sp.]|nr:hypothetical protein [Conexibacter sp.]
MRFPTSIVGVLVAVAAVAVGGCGEERTAGERDRTSSAATAPREERPAEQATSVPPDARTLPKRALVQLADLPSGWGRELTSVPDLRCSLRPFAKARTAATRYRQGRTAVQETVGIFPTAAASRRSYALLNARSSMDCVRRNARRRMSEQAQGPASRPEVARVDPLGRWGKAIRLISSVATQIGKTGGYIDVVHVRVGRGVAALVILSGPRVVDEVVYEDVVAALERRLRDALA